MSQFRLGNQPDGDGDGGGFETSEKVSSSLKLGCRIIRTSPRSRRNDQLINKTNRSLCRGRKSQSQPVLVGKQAPIEASEPSIRNTWPACIRRISLRLRTTILEKGVFPPRLGLQPPVKRRYRKLVRSFATWPSTESGDWWIHCLDESRQPTADSDTPWPALQGRRTKCSAMASVTKLDLHAHILPEKWPDLKSKFGYGGWIQMHKVDDADAGYEMRYDDGTFFRKVEKNLFDPTTRIREMDATGVTIQALSTVPALFSYWAEGADVQRFHRFLNDHIAGVVKDHPDRFVGMATVPLQSPLLAAEELKRVRSELHMKCVEIGSHINLWDLNSSELDPFYRAAEDLGVSIFVHPWDMQMDGRMRKYWMPWLVGMPAETSQAICCVLFGAVLERFPRLKFCFAHGAGSFPYTLGRIERGFNCRPDLCAVDNDVPPSSYMGKIYADSLVHDEKALNFLVDIFGQDRVCLGSDYPFPLGEIERPGALIENASLSESLRERLLWRNGAEFLGMHLSSI